jgi:chromosome segregation ATPase
VTQSQTSEPVLEERELELAMREAELNRREAALRRGGFDDDGPPLIPGRHDELEAELTERIAMLERREKELLRTVEAVEAQRQRLEDVRADYEERRDALAARAKEVEAERDRLREQQARLVSASIELQTSQAEAAVAAAVAAARAKPIDPIPATTDALLEPPAPPVPEPPVSIDEWWAKQLGKPLEAA